MKLTDLTIADLKALKDIKLKKYEQYSLDLRAYLVQEMGRKIDKIDEELLRRENEIEYN